MSGEQRRDASGRFVRDEPIAPTLDGTDLLFQIDASRAKVGLRRLFTAPAKQPSSDEDGGEQQAEPAAAPGSSSAGAWSGGPGLHVPVLRRDPDVLLGRRILDQARHVRARRARL